MRAGILVDLAPLNSLTREIKKPGISEIEIKSVKTLIKISLYCSLTGEIDAGDLRLKRDIVSFVCLGFALAIFFIGLSSVDIVFLYLIDSLRDRSEVSKNFLLLLSLSVFLLLVFLLLALVIAAILVALKSNIFLKKALI